MQQSMQLIEKARDYPQFKSGRGSLVDEFDLAAVATRYDSLKRATARQTISSDLTEILSIAAESMSEMTRKAVDYAALMSGNLEVVNVKAWTSAAFKVENEYSGNARLLCDPVRATIVIPSDNVNLARAVLALHASTCAVKDLLACPSKTGLAILNSKIQLDNGLKGEIQIVTPHMREAMLKTHGRYKEIDTLAAQFSDTVIPISTANQIRALKADCQDLHATAAHFDGLDRYVDKRAGKSHLSPA